MKKSLVSHILFKINWYSEIVVWTITPLEILDYLSETIYIHAPWLSRPHKCTCASIEELHMYQRAAQAVVHMPQVYFHKDCS